MVDLSWIYSVEQLFILKRASFYPYLSREFPRLDITCTVVPFSPCAFHFYVHM